MIVFAVVPPLVTLTTDFGLQDSYVGVVKGVILSIAPHCQIIDITHEVPPQRVATASFHLLVAYRYFPPETVHVVVVDPGVGTARRAIGVRSALGTFIAPDNGVLSATLADHEAMERTSGVLRVEGRTLSNAAYHLDAVSTTFHGRDVFAPVAGHLAAGAGFSQVGDMISQIQVLEDYPLTHDTGEITGVVVHIDRYGNAITNIPGVQVATKSIILVAGRTIVGVAHNYQAGPLLALRGSSGYLEVAAGNGSAADALDIDLGDAVRVQSVE